MKTVTRFDQSYFLPSLSNEYSNFTVYYRQSDIDKQKKLVKVNNIAAPAAGHMHPYLHIKVLDENKSLYPVYKHLEMHTCHYEFALNERFLFIKNKIKNLGVAGLSVRIYCSLIHIHSRYRDMDYACIDLDKGIITYYKPDKETPRSKYIFSLLDGVLEEAKNIFGYNYCTIVCM